MQIMLSRAAPDNGFAGWARLLGLLRVLVLSRVPRIVLVGAAGWKAAWIVWGRDATGSKGEDAWRDKCVEVLVGEGLEEEEALEQVQERFVVLTEEEYRAEVGERAWRVETVARLADLEEGEA
jgi:hypothetical protein